MSTADTSYTFDATTDDFEHKVLALSWERPVVVDFWAPWCGPCRALGPLLEKAIAQRAGSVVLAKVNIDEAQELAARYRVQSIPAVIAFKDGQPAREFVGALPEQQINSFLDLLMPTEADKLVREAHALISSDPHSAEKIYRQALEHRGNQDDARLGLAQLLIDQRRFDGVVELLDAVTMEGDRGDRARRLMADATLLEKAAGLGSLAEVQARLDAEPSVPRRRYELGLALAAQGDYADALPHLLQAGEADFALASGPVREAMVQVFHALGDGHALANEYRAKLSQLLF